MRDVFPEEAQRYQALEQTARRHFAGYGCGEIRTPLVEHTVLFERGVGQGTDIVNKEMFYVPAKEQEEAAPDEAIPASRRMVLRPEATASVVRAYLEHEIDKAQPGVQKYFYIGPMFRYERPQRGRLRQFTQIGVELLGSAQPAMDAEALVMLHDLLDQAGLPNLSLQINSVGCPQCRPEYIHQLRAYVQPFQDRLCPDCCQRFEKNPLRLFDCKQAGCRESMAQAPSIQEHLCPDCREHQAQTLALLERTGMAYRINPRLMRGLDYYTRTVFEVTSENLGAQNAVAAGGRYDNLVSELSGPPTPAVGWSLGVERLLELLPANSAPAGLDVYVVAAGPDATALFLNILALRRQGVSVGLDYEAKSSKALMKRANRLAARFALFVSNEDPGKIELKNMVTGEQLPSAWDKVAEQVKA
jgi:histidyl-tRNA synthetase